MTNTIGDTLSGWINGMDNEERMLYQNIKKAYGEIGLAWNQQNELEFASIADTDFRKEAMKNYLERLNHRLTAPVCPRPDSWSI